MEPKEESEEAAFAHTILFVCMGNICRSPTAEGAFKHVLAERAPDLSIRADSAGTHAYHVGEPPDPRAQRAAERRGIELLCVTQVIRIRVGSIPPTTT